MDQGSVNKPFINSFALRATAPFRKNTLNKRIVQVIIHMVAWVCFLMLPLFFFPRPIDASFIPEQALTLFFFLSNFFYIAFYYFNSNVLIPRLLEQKRIAAYTIIIV